MNFYKLLTYREEVCTDPEHDHKTPVQKMATIQILDRVFDVTNDDEVFNVRTAGHGEKFGLTFADVMRFIFDVFSREVN